MSPHFNTKKSVFFQAQNEFVEIASVHQQTHHVMRYFNPGVRPKKPETFLEKFYAGE